ncbi:MAG: hypothetical protein KAJ33_05855, partial [Thermoplasmata archaeon]|nr:hypothetical protein [Thermoplasmata archaeon]
MKHGREGNNLKIGTMLLISCLLIMVLASVNDAQASTRQSLPVYNIDSSSYYNTIQEGIDAASSGDALEIAPGIYYENIIIDKELTLTGANQTTTIIDGSSNGTVVLITEDLVEFSGFTIRNSGPNMDDTGIHLLGAKNTTIFNITMTNNEVGMFVSSTFSSGDSSPIKIFDGPNDYPLINNLGQVTWRGWGQWSTYLNSTDQIYFWDGTEVIQITNYTDSYVGNPRINNAGSVVWTWGLDDLLSEIYLWNGTEIIQITDNFVREYDPEINDNGEITWSQENDIYIWNGNDIIQITNDSYANQRPQINDNGSVVWQGNGQIYLWNGIDTLQLTNNTSNNRIPRINNQGHVFWECFPELRAAEIHYWDGTNIIEVTNNTYHDLDMEVNNYDQMVWVAESFAGDIMFWDGSQVIQVSDNNDNERPDINNQGHLVWNGYFNKEVYFWDGESISILTGADNIGSCASINDNDQVVWSSICNEVYSVYFWGGGNITGDYANNNSIFNNTISENEHGIRIDTAYGNQIYHNLFLNNSNQSFCQQSNDWDLGYPNGGNFWSDYDGTDEYSGPDQDIPGSDGIGDIPYAITGGGYVDHYPMMSVSTEIPVIITPPVDPPIDLPIDIPGDPAGISWMPIVFGSAIGISLALGMSLE